MAATTGCLILAVVCVGLIALSLRANLKNADKAIVIWKYTVRVLKGSVNSLQSQLDTTTHHNRDLQAKIDELESERRAYDLTVANCDHLRAENERLASQLLKPDNDEQAVSDLAKLVYQGWHRCNEAANGQFSGYYSKPFVTADGEYELIYRRRGSLGVAGGEPTLASVIDEAFCHANRMTERTA